MTAIIIATAIMIAIALFLNPLLSWFLGGMRIEPCQLPVALVGDRCNFPAVIDLCC
jgi:hypothetical protein